MVIWHLGVSLSWQARLATLAADKLTPQLKEINKKNNLTAERKGGRRWPAWRSAFLLARRRYSNIRFYSRRFPFSVGDGGFSVFVSIPQNIWHIAIYFALLYDKIVYARKSAFTTS